MKYDASSESTSYNHMGALPEHADRKHVVQILDAAVMCRQLQCCSQGGPDIPYCHVVHL